MRSHTLEERNPAVRPEVPIYSSHFDLMRGLAALTVMIGHLKFFLGGTGKPATGVTGFVAPLVANANQMNPAHEAVIVFFVLSGVLVGGSVLRDQRSEVFSWSHYLLKRLSRLLTVLLPALVLGFVIDSATKYALLRYTPRLTSRLADLSSVSLDWQTFVGNLCFLQTLDRTRIPSFGTNAALWSLAFEFWYYLLFPLIVGALLLRSRRRQVVYGLLAILVGYLLWSDPLSRFPIWLFGALATRLPLCVPQRWQRLAVGLLTVQFLAIAGLLWVRPLPNFLFDDMLLGVSFTALVFAILHRQTRRPKTFYASLAESVAKPSYSVYLFHLPILTFVGVCSTLYLPGWTSHRFAAVLTIGSLVFGLCYLLYFAFEARTERVRKISERAFGLQQPRRLPVLRGEFATLQSTVSTPKAGQ